MRQAEPDVRSYAVTHRNGQLILPQAEQWDQLIYSAHGAVTVHTGLGSWVVPPHRAVWVPGGVGHRIDVAGRTSLRTLYFAARLQALPARCQVIAVSRLLRELILHAVATAPLYLSDLRHSHLVAVLVDLLDSVAPDPALQLPAPAEPRARALADLLRSHHSEPITALASLAGASRRTLERLFLAETGMTIGEWRRRLRMLEALRLLADGRAVSWVAGAVGYSTPSAFSTAFRAELGSSPAQYLRSTTSARQG
ncbi:AraC family transcriptional regulator [Lentzea tibetensis]|nr:helix-turn-helix transcriptional regulator [Lentzea tibetensis]